MHNRFRYTGEQYDPVTGQYYLRARYYNPVIARFTQEDTYYGDGLNLYTYCQNNPILYHDPTGHGTKENSPYSKREQQYVDVGADPDTARLAAQCYPDAKSKQDLYNKYKSQGYNATDAKKLANYEIIHGENNAKNYAANNVKKSGTDYTATSSRENPNTDWRTLNRLNANAGESGNNTKLNYVTSNGLVLETTPNKTTTVLGTYKSDTGSILDELGNVKSLDFGPRDGGFNLLNTPDELYVSPNQFWNEYNKPWLDNAIARDDIFKIATEPTWDNLTRINMFTGKTELTGFGREYTYLKKHGYSFDAVTKTMFK